MQPKSFRVSTSNLLTSRMLPFVLAVALVAPSLFAGVQLAFAAPTITANPNPVVIPEGKTEGTTMISWDAGVDRGDSRVWLQVDGGKEDIFAASAKGTSEIKVVMGKTYIFRLYSGDGAQVLASITVKAQPPKPSLPTIPPSAPGARPAYIYGVLPNGTLRWYRHDGRGRGSTEWQGPRDITSGFQGLKQIFGSVYKYFFTIASDGALKRYPHSATDVAGDFATRGDFVPRNAGNGWLNFKHVFSTGGESADQGDHIIYAVAQDGTLKWYRYTPVLVYGDKPWQGPKDIGSGWGNFKNVFSTGNGVIYAITPEGKLLWHKHNFYEYGVGSEGQGKDGLAAWEGPREVGRGWQNFKHVFSSGEGVIYAVTKEGKLLWYQHQGFLTGSNIWLGPREVGISGWENFEHVFALMDRPKYDSDRSKPAEVKRVPPVFSTRPESSPFFRDLIVQPGSDGAIISFTPSDDSRTAIAASTHKPLSFPETIPYDKKMADMFTGTGMFLPEAKVSVFCAESWANTYPNRNDPHTGRRDCRQINGLAPNTTYYFVITAYTYKYVEKPEFPKDNWQPVSVFYYSGSFKTKSLDTLRPRKV